MPPAPDAEEVKAALGRFPTGVALLTTVTDDGGHQGLTASSFTSVALDPLLVLVCVQQSARFHDQVLSAGRFGVSVLSAEMEHVSRFFATHGRPWSAADFDPFPHQPGPKTGCLLLTEALAAFECAVWSTAPGGDHTIVVGEVVSIGSGAREGSPLVYVDGNYRPLPPAPPGTEHKA